MLLYMRRVHGFQVNSSLLPNCNSEVDIEHTWKTVVAKVWKLAMPIVGFEPTPH